MLKNTLKYITEQYEYYDKLYWDVDYKIGEAEKNLLSLQNTISALKSQLDNYGKKRDEFGTMIQESQNILDSLSKKEK